MINFNRSMTSLMAEIVRFVPEFHPIQSDRVLVSAAFQRGRRRSGLLAYVLPLRYRDGCPVERRVKGMKVYHWAMLPYQHEGVEILYIVYFMLPRFLKLGFREKIETVIHELYHISPDFNGDLRRFRGRSRLHGGMREYDYKVKQITDAFLAAPHDSNVYEFLRRASDGELQAMHVAEPRPRLVKVATLSEIATPS